MRRANADLVAAHELMLRATEKLREENTQLRMLGKLCLANGGLDRPAEAKKTRIAESSVRNRQPARKGKTVEDQEAMLQRMAIERRLAAEREFAKSRLAAAQRLVRASLAPHPPVFLFNCALPDSWSDEGCRPERQVPWVSRVATSLVVWPPLWAAGELLEHRMRPGHRRARVRGRPGAAIWRPVLRTRAMTLRRNSPHPAAADGRAGQWRMEVRATRRW